MYGVFSYFLFSDDNILIPFICSYLMVGYHKAKLLGKQHVGKRILCNLYNIIKNIMITTKYLQMDVWNGNTSQ